MSQELFPVSDLAARYGVGKTHLYQVRLAALEKINLGTPTRRQNKSYVSLDQLKFLDALNEAIQNGQTADEFLNDRLGIDESSLEDSELSANSSELMPNKVEQVQLFGMMLEAIRPQPKPLENLEALQKAVDHRWHLSSSQLSPLLGLKHLKGDVIERYGFRCERQSKTGRESEWKISKIED